MVGKGLGAKAQIIKLLWELPKLGKNNTTSVIYTMEGALCPQGDTCRTQQSSA